MTSSHDLSELIWATRGRAWGFRFLLTGGVGDPLQQYELVLSELGDVRTGYCRVDKQVGLRFADPLGRRDASGRVIPHEFVLSGALADQVRSVEDGVQHVWPLVAKVYNKIWVGQTVPAEEELQALLRHLG